MFGFYKHRTWVRRSFLNDMTEKAKTAERVNFSWKNIIKIINIYKVHASFVKIA